MSKTLKQICDAAMYRIGLNPDPVYFGGNDRTIAYLANESLNFIIRQHNWQELRKQETISMTTATEYDFPDDIKYYVADSMNADGQERFIQYPTPIHEWWYFKSNNSSGIRYLVRQFGDKIEIQNPDSGVDIIYEYISKYPVQSDRASTPDREEFSRDTDTWLLDDELLILDLRWRYMKTKQLEGWQDEARVAETYLRRLKGQVDGATTLHFGDANAKGNIPYTDLYVDNP